MSTNNWASVTSDIREVLIDRYGERESSNIASYYRDCLVDIPSPEKLESDIAKLQQGFPVQYVTGIAFFYGHRFHVNDHVLIPRPETEELVHWVVSDNKHREGLEILDIGTGSGCILISTLKKIDNAIGIGVDVDKEVIEVAKKNAEYLDVSSSFLQADILSIEHEHLFRNVDIVISNPPYITLTEKTDLHVHSHEPHLALYVDEPLIFYIHIIESMKKVGTDGRLCYLEINPLFKDELEGYLESYDLRHEFQKDLQGKWRMLKVYF